MKGWGFVYFDHQGAEHPLPKKDVDWAIAEYEKHRGAKIVSLGTERLRRRLQQVPQDLRGPMALIHILSALPTYYGLRIEAIELRGNQLTGGPAP